MFAGVEKVSLPILSLALRTTICCAIKIVGCQRIFAKRNRLARRCFAVSCMWSKRGVVGCIHTTNTFCLKVIAVRVLQDRTFSMFAIMNLS